MKLIFCNSAPFTKIYVLVIYIHLICLVVVSIEDREAVRSESLDCRARNKDKANDIENTAAYTPRREQMNILEFMRKRKKHKHNT